MIAPGYKRLTVDQVRILNGIEGGSHGNKQLAKLIDDALDIVAGELPSSIPQANVANLVTDLAAKLTASAAVHQAAIGALAPVGTTDGSGGAGDAALATDVDTRLGTLQAKVDAVISAMVTAGLMAP